MISLAQLFVIVVALMGCSKVRPAVIGDRPQLKFLIAGQSNAVSPANDHVQVWSKTGLVTVTDMYHGRGQFIPTPQNGADSSVAWVYLGDLFARPVEFVNVAVGGRSTQVWRDQLTEARLVPALVASSFDAVLWVQGESDIGERIAEHVTYDNMRAIIQRSREIRPGLVWYVAINSHRLVAGENSVRSAQRRIIADGLAIQGPDLDRGIRDHQEFCDDDCGEFNGRGLAEHGRLWFEVLK